MERKKKKKKSRAYRYVCNGHNLKAEQMKIKSILYLATKIDFFWFHTMMAVWDCTAATKSGRFTYHLDLFKRLCIVEYRNIVCVAKCTIFAAVNDFREMNETNKKRLFFIYLCIATDLSF